MHQLNLGRLLLGVGASYIFINLLGSVSTSEDEYEEEDTVNYALYWKRKLVYHGIVYEDRLDARLYEHEYNGKIFDHCVFDHPRTRSHARRVEQKRIRRDHPKYNVQHNCY